VSQRMKIGELARRTGLSIRSLHYYEEIGLLHPVHRADSGHRLYGVRDIVRLQQIKSLRQLGFSLDEIRHCFARRTLSARKVIEMHLERVRGQIELQRQLCERLEAIAEHLGAPGPIPVAHFLQSIEVMTMIDKYFTPEQRKQLRERRETIGDERIQQAQQEWQELIELVRAEMDAGTDPTSAPVKALAVRWGALVREFSGGDATIERSVGNMYKNEPQVAERYGMDAELFAYVGKAAAALESE